MSIEQDLFTSTQRGDVEATEQLNKIFLDATLRGASDIHFEDEASFTRVRMRINDPLIEVGKLTRDQSLLLDQKIRMKAGLASSERQMPLDGRFFLNFVEEGRRLDVRVSILRTYNSGGPGQKIVCRLLDQSRAAMKLEALPFPPAVHAALDRVLLAKYGMVLATGPTGSGKSSTLYAMLNRFVGKEVNVMTVENPVEYAVPGFAQVSIEPPKLTFPAVLRAFLRQDPDVILVGEIRDGETAQIAAEAALTGHLLFSTLHTNTAAQSVLRLVQKGVPAYTLSQTLLCVIAQRLIQRACPHCREIAEPTREQRALLSRIKYIEVGPFYETRGCEECNHSGLDGRHPVVEVIVVDDAVREAIERSDIDGVIKAAASQPQYRSIAHAVMDACVLGYVPLHVALETAARETTNSASVLLKEVSDEAA